MIKLYKQSKGKDNRYFPNEPTWNYTYFFKIFENFFNPLKKFEIFQLYLHTDSDKYRSLR